MTPLNMFDAAKVGAKALRAEDIGNPKKPGAIIKEANAVPFDPNAGWKEGDILPGRLISRTTPRARPPITMPVLVPERTAPIRSCGGASLIPDIRLTTRS